MVTAASWHPWVSALSTFVLPIIIPLSLGADGATCCGLLPLALVPRCLASSSRGIARAGLRCEPACRVKRCCATTMPLAAGVFEEPGRVQVRRSASERPVDGVGRALGAGIGHGGIEAILLVE